MSVPSETHDELHVRSRSDYVTPVDADDTVAPDDSHTITVAAEVHTGFDEDCLGNFQLGNRHTILCNPSQIHGIW